MANPQSSHSSLQVPQGMEITAEIKPGYDAILTREALELVATLHRAFEPRRQQLLQARAERTKRLDAGERPDFLAETKSVREGDWKIAPLPQDLQCRRVEITGPVERKMIINALNSGADSLHDRLRRFEYAELGQPDHRPYQSEGRGAPHDLAGTERQVVHAQRQGRHADRASARLASGREAREGRRQARVGRHLRLRALHGAQREGTSRARRGPVLLSAEDGEPSRSASVERHLRRRAGSGRRAARHDSRDGADRNHRRRLRNGRDPVRAARTQLGPERRPLGLHLLGDQEVQGRPRLLPGRPLARSR